MKGRSVFDEHLGDVFAVFDRGHVFLFGEDADEIRLVVEAAGVADLRGAERRVGKQLAGLGDAHVVDEGDVGDVRALLEKVRKGRFRHVDQPGHVGEPDVLAEVFLDVVADFGDAARFGGVDNVLRVAEIAHKHLAVGRGQRVENVQKSGRRLESLHAREFKNPVPDAQLFGTCERKPLPGVEQQLPDGEKQAFVDDREVDQVARELDGDDVVGFQGRFPHVRHIGTGHHQVQRAEILGGIAHDARSPGVHHQIDLVFRMAVDRIVEMRVGVVEDDEKVLVRDRGDLLLYLFHVR